MARQEYLNFDQIVHSWKNALRSFSIEYLALLEGTSWKLQRANLALGTVDIPEQVNQVVTTSALRIGKISRNVNADEIDSIIRNALAGKITLDGLELALGEKVEIFLPISAETPTYFAVNAVIRLDSSAAINTEFSLSMIESELRCHQPPFDGLHDVLTFFGLASNGYIPHERQISFTLHPPIDLLLAECTLQENQCTVQFLRAPGLPITDINVGLRLFPNPTFDRRMSGGLPDKWTVRNDGLVSGKVVYDLPECSAVQIFVSAGGYSTRRHLLFDPQKSINPRVATYRKFDPGLEALLSQLYPEPQKSRDLEKGVALLLYLHGLSSAVVAASNAPDVVFLTPGGRTGIIECTTRLAAIHEKVSKLVSRRHTLVGLGNSNAPVHEVLAFLVVNQPRDSLASDAKFVSEQQVVLVTKEDLDRAVAEVDVPKNVDEIFEILVRQMSTVGPDNAQHPVSL